MGRWRQKMSEERKQELIAQVKPLVDRGYTPREIREELGLWGHELHFIIKLARGETYEQYLEYYGSLQPDEK